MPPRADESLRRVIIVPLIYLHAFGVGVEDELAPFRDAELIALVEVHASAGGGGDRRRVSAEPASLGMTALPYSTVPTQSSR